MIETGRTLGADGGEAEFREKLARIAWQKPEDEPAAPSKEHRK